MNPDSEKCFKLAETWLEDCVKKHASICGRATSIFQPTRLVDVGPSDGSKDPHLWIASEEQPDSQGGYKSMQSKHEYAALSYCWGNASFLTLTSSTIEALRSSIPMNSLPRTVQDAIVILRRLGIRYLWVDSLCIIQGSDKEAQKDWVHVSENMALVYRAAFLTIAAAGANDAHEGIFQQRKRAMQHCFLDYNCSSSSGILGRVSIGPSYEKNCWSSEPLDCRAWALQERLLSARILEYGTTEMSWKCFCTFIPESGTKSRTSTVIDFTTRSGSPNTSKDLPLFLEEAQDIRLHWTSIVEDYSGREMTKASDKLPALAGLVKMVQAFYADKYLAGIWELQLPEQLLWKHLGRTVSGVHKYPMPSRYRAPSWSWASVDGKVEFCKYITEVKRFAPGPKELTARGVRIISCQVKSSLPAGLGGVFYGEVICDGFVRQMATIRCESVGRYYGGYEHYYPWMHFANGMKTYLDNVDGLPKRIRKLIPGDYPKELFKTWFLFITPDLSTGLILLRKGKLASFRGKPTSFIPIFRRIGLFEGYDVRGDEFNERKIQRMVLRIV